MVKREENVIEDGWGEKEYLKGGESIKKIEGDMGRIDKEIMKRELKSLKKELVKEGKKMEVRIKKEKEVGKI